MITLDIFDLHLSAWFKGNVTVQLSAVSHVYTLYYTAHDKLVYSVAYYHRYSPVANKNRESHTILPANWFNIYGALSIVYCITPVIYVPETSQIMKTRNLD